ncbi:hypothetical protein Tco_0829388 [Tanacetum coccineum]
MSNLLRIKRRLMFESTPHVENEVDELHTVRLRDKGYGSRACMYPGRIKPRGFGVSWDPVDGEAMLGNVMGIPAPAWPLGITPEDCRIHAERPEDVVLQEKLLLQEHYQLRMFAQRLRKQQQLEQDFNEVESSFTQLPYYFHNLKLANEGTVTHIETDDEGCFKMCFLAFDLDFCIVYAAVDKNDGAHLKGTYKGTNLLVIGMDANNQIIPLATAVSQGETVETWSYSDKLKAWYWKTCKDYTVHEFERSISGIKALRPEAYRKLEDDGFEKWSRAHYLANRYNYMTSNCAESINALTKTVRKVPITMLMDYYRDLIQMRNFERRYTGEATKVRHRMLKSAKWTICGVDRFKVYQVRDNKTVHIIDLGKRECSCRKW